MSQSDSKWRMYSDFYDLFVKANPKLPKEKAQVEANIVWNSLKVGKKIDIDLYRGEMTRLGALVIKKKQTMLDFLLKPTTQKSLPATTSKGDSSKIVTGAASNIESNNDAKVVKETSITTNLNVVLSDVFKDSETVEEKATEEDSNNLHEKSDSCDKLDVEIKTAAQDRLNEQLGAINTQLVTLNDARNIGISLGDVESVNVAGITKKINDVKKKKEDVLRSLSKLKSGQKAQKKFRIKQRKIMKKVVTEYPDLAHEVTVRTSSGRPPLEDSYSDLHKTVLDIAIIGAAASEKRRENIFRSVKTLDDLHSAIHQLGFKIYRTALYYRLVPHSSKSNDGKRHVNTVPVK